MNRLEITCQVRWDFKGTSIPVRELNVLEIRERIQKVFGFQRLSSPEELVRKALSDALGRAEQGETLSSSLAGEASIPAIEFYDGWIEHDGRRVVVEALSIRRGTLYARVGGETLHAEAVLLKLLEMVKEAVPEFEPPQPIAKDYATKGKYKLDFGIEDLFSSAFLGFINNDLRRVILEHASGDEEDWNIVVHPYDVKLKLHALRRDGTLPPGMRDWSFRDFSMGHESFSDHDERVYDVFARFRSDATEQLLIALEELVARQNPLPRS